MVNGYVATRLI